MPANFTISQKGLILVLIPVAFELVFVLILSGLLHQAEADLAKQAHSRAIIENANVLMRHYLEASTAAGGYGFTHNHEFIEKYDLAVDNAHKQYKAIAALIKSEPAKLAKFKKVVLAGEDMFKMIQKFRIAIDNVPASLVNLGTTAGFQRAKQAVELIGVEMGHFLAEEEEVARMSPEVQAHHRHQIEMVLWGGVVINVLMAVALSLYFSRQIAARLSLMIDNTIRFGKSQSLHPRIQGTDEIAHLDSVFHTMTEEITELDRLKQEFVAMVSHELRTPLTSVHGTLTLLESGALGELSDKARKRIVTAEIDINRLIALINDLLDAEKLESGSLDMHVSPHTFADVMERSRISVEGFAEQKQISLNMEDVPADLLVLADEDRTVQVMVNLLSNAIKFSRPGSSVTVTTEVGSDDVLVKVIDQGRGIATADLSKVFERFKQLEAADATRKGGSGLGLHICRKIIEQMNGTIGVESELGKGSTFYFKLPRQLPVKLDAPAQPKKC